MSTTFAPYSSSTETSTLSTDSTDGSVSWIFVSSALVAIFGTASNSLSLSYFITNIRSSSHTRNSEAKYNTKLYLALNIFDLLVSVSSTLRWMFDFFNVELAFEVSRAVNKTSVYSTGFLTCVLAVIRTIHLVLPLHTVDWCAVKISLGVYSVIIAGLRLFYFPAITGEPGYPDFLYHNAIFGPIDSPWQTLFYLIYHIESLILAGLFIIVVLANVISLGKLCFSQSQTASWKRKATITVGIISVIYCVCNLGYVVMFIMPLHNIDAYFSIPDTVHDISDYVLLPLNSACNPAVFLARKADMRSHVAMLWQRLVRFLCCRKKNETQVELLTGEAGAESFKMISTIGKILKENGNVNNRVDP